MFLSRSPLSRAGQSDIAQRPFVPRKRRLTRFSFYSLSATPLLHWPNVRRRAINYQIQRARHTYLVNLVDGFTGGRWPRSRRPPKPVVNAGRRIPSGACVDSLPLMERPVRSSRHHLCRRGRPCRRRHRRRCRRRRDYRR